jgi:hypothetical protein
MNVTMRPLTPAEAAARDAGLSLAARLTNAILPLSSEQVQDLYDALLVDRVDDGEATIAVGLAFGQLIADRAGYEWVHLSDEFGEETCLAPYGKEVSCSPISMIQKRVKRGESVDLNQLCDDVIQMIGHKIEHGEVADR